MFIHMYLHIHIFMYNDIYIFMYNDTIISLTTLQSKEESKTSSFLQNLTLDFKEPVLKLFCFSYLVISIECSQNVILFLNLHTLSFF